MTLENLRIGITLPFMTLFLSVAQAAVEPGKYYRIVPSANASKSLFVGNASLAEKAAVVVWTETGVPAQQWQAMDAGNGQLGFKNVYTGKYLDASNLSVSQRTDLSGWQLEVVDESRNEYLLKQNKYLRVVSATDGRQPMVGNNPQTWLLEEVEPQLAFDATVRHRMAVGYLGHYLQDKGNGYRTFQNGGWGEAETLETLLDCYEITGDQSFLSVFESCYRYMRYHVGMTWNSGTAVAGYDWFGYDYNDDVMWMIIAAARAYHLTGTQSYLNDAKRNFDLIWSRAYLNYAGLLRWAEYSGDRNGANSCINGPAEVAACYIAAGTGDEQYYEKARQLYENQRRYLFVAATGQVYDSVVLDPNSGEVMQRNTWASTYNQGTMLGAAVLLYRHFGTQQYKDDADRILAYAKQHLCNSDGLVHVCQNADGDFQGFKGILMRYAGLYAREFGDTSTRDWLIKNAFHAYNNMNAQGFGHSAWLTKAAENLLFGEVDYGLEGSSFGASTALTAAYSVALTDLASWRQPLTASEARQEANKELTFTYNAARSGRYQVNVCYLADEARIVFFSANQGDSQPLTCPVSKSAENRVMAHPVLTAGSNTLQVSCESGLPAISHLEVMFLCDVSATLEAEYGVSRGQLTLGADDDASGGRYVNNIGNGSGNQLSLKYDAAEVGQYYLDITYFAGQDRQMYVRMNGGTKVVDIYPSTGGWQASTAQTKRVAVTMKAGTNTIVLGNDTGSAPCVDKITVLSQQAAGSVAPPTAAPSATHCYALNGMPLQAPPATGVYIKGSKKYLIGK